MEYACCLPDRVVSKAATGTASGGISTQRCTQVPSQSVAQTSSCAPGQPGPAAGSARLALVPVPAFRARPGTALPRSTPLAGAREALRPLSCRAMCSLKLPFISTLAPIYILELVLRADVLHARFTEPPCLLAHLFLH